MKKLTNKKILITALCAILVVVAMVFTFAACDGNKDKEPTSTTESTSLTTEEVVTDEVVPTIEDETTTETETEAPTKAPETTAKPAPKPTEKPKETKPAKDEVNDFDTGELPTYADGSIDFGAMHEDTEEELGGVVYF